jgi:hypothetical protein
MADPLDAEIRLGDRHTAPWRKPSERSLAFAATFLYEKPDSLALVIEQREYQNHWAQILYVCRMLM